MAASRKAILSVGVCIAGLYIAVLVVGRVHAASELRADTNAAAIQDVTIVTPRHAARKVAITLPGTLDAWYQAPIYPQASGYVKMWYRDYGAEVKAGDILAEINAPSLDAQYAQAKADYAAAEAKYNLAAVTAQRWQAMGKSQSVSGQSVSVSLANLQSEKANLEAAQHNVDRFEALERFKQLVAPFDGVVTARDVSVGDYVNAGGGNLTAQGSATELFTVADVHKLRLFVSVPEVFAYILQPGLEAKFSVPQFPGKTFIAQFLTVARGFDPNTRTAITEFTIDNHDRQLWPGTFASVDLTAKNTNDKLFEIPTGCLVFMEKGMQVVVVDDTNHVHFRNVVVGRQGDRDSEIQSGLAAGDHVILNPPADLLEGQEVHVTQPAAGYLATNDGSDSDE
ncbi:efflux RND transporter periplasmic adaptor subunit [Brytella acorum]|uniref:Efflux RND transporter periplasmic adaptor subunit n=1 Tax=Brytella acorum TaxID=2959299 RepID=A0AA35UP47_9PROT|nr:efflux RND transporter periplasmic adaptor subunit [Brytella acorum]MDF3625078.1 efflux RND transporter periplasmic adaptor subunit [Brytella acorum]CAI9121043.1 efflux RND transporter periplasmic adaptor subunit [Brytella acorum]